MSEPQTVGVTGDAELVAGAAMLGASVLVQIVDGTADGVLLCDEDARCVYVNPATCRLLGRPAPDLVGYKYEKAMPPRLLDAARGYFAAVLEGSTEVATYVFVDAEGGEREVVLAGFRVSVDGRPHGAALVRDFTDSRAAGRSAAGLAQSAAELVGNAPTNEILSGIARHAVEGTSAMWAGLAAVGQAGSFAFAGAYGPDGADVGDPYETEPALSEAPAEQILEALTAGAIRLGEAPGRAVTMPRSTWERHLGPPRYGRTVLHHDWQFAVCIPLAYDNRVTGALTLLLPTGTTALDDPEITFCTALANYAAVAAANEHLAARSARNAELRERGRVARELHDSVSQALFAMTMHARTAQLALARTGLQVDTALAQSLEQLSQLSRGTLAEMRAMIFELRPEALADEGLVRALKTQAAAISAREHVTITVDGPTGRLPLDAEVEAEVYRMVAEVLRDEIRQLSAESVDVTLVLENHQLRVTIIAGGGAVRSPAERDRSRLAGVAGRAETPGGTLEVTDGDRRSTSIVVPLVHPSSRVGAEL